MIDRDKVKEALTVPITSIRTPFTQESEVDHEGLRSTLDFNIEAGSKTMLMTAGDSHYISMSDAEIAEVSRTVVEHVGGRAMVVTADRFFNTRQAVEFARYCREIGSDVHMVLPPDWAGSCTVETLCEHYAAVAEEMPVVVVTGVFSARGEAFGLDVLERVRDTVPNVVAIKDDVLGPFARKMTLLVRDSWAVFSGGQKQNHLDLHPYGCHGFMSTFMSFKPDVTHRYWDAIQRGDLSEAFRPGIATGTPLDHRLELVPGRMFVVGGRPGHGKTTMLLQLTLAALTRAPESVALFASCEMNAVEIGIKALSCLEGRNFPGEVRLGGEAALVDVIAAREMWAPLLSRLVVLTTRSMEKVEAEATRISRAAPLSVVSVDYLQRFNYSGNLESHALAVGEVSGGCKALAQRLDVVVLAGAQLNRAGDDSKPPTLKHLKASGDIEQDADGVALLHRPDQDDPEAAAQLLVAKNRWGELGAIRIEPDLACHRFGW